LPNPDKPELKIEDRSASGVDVASGFAFGYDPTGRSVIFL
jgi:hypothetical protein